MVALENLLSSISFSSKRQHLAKLNELFSPFSLALGCTLRVAAKIPFLPDRLRS